MNWLSCAGRMVTGRHAERQTTTFTEPVRVQIDMADDPAAPRQLIAHSGAGRVRIRRD